MNFTWIEGTWSADGEAQGLPAAHNEEGEDFYVWYVVAFRHGWMQPHLVPVRTATTLLRCSAALAQSMHEGEGSVVFPRWVYRLTDYVAPEPPPFTKE